MILKRIKVNSGLEEDTNCYIIADEKTNEAMVIDPGGQVDKIVEMLEILNVEVKYILLTHCHGDHVAGVKELKERVGGKVLIHRIDYKGLYDENINLGFCAGIENLKLEADSRVDDKDLLHIGEIELQVIHTPGHTKGSICLYSKEYKMLFSGDTIFRGTWGRTDLPTGSLKDIEHSISNKLMILPEDTIVYPGHGKSTMIREEESIYLSLVPKKE